MQERFYVVNAKTGERIGGLYRFEQNAKVVLAKCQNQYPEKEYQIKSKDIAIRPPVKEYKRR